MMYISPCPIFTEIYLAFLVDIWMVESSPDEMSIFAFSQTHKDVIYKYITLFFSENIP